MFRLRIHLLLVLLAVTAHADDPKSLISQATAAYQAEDYRKSAELYEAAIRAGADAAKTAYNAACCHALLGKPDDAFKWLNNAFNAGWRDVEQLKADADFKSLRADPRWEQAVKRCEQVLAAFVRTLKEPALRQELLKRLQEDQRIRLVPNPDLHEWKRIDAENTAFMKKVIKRHGWPGKSVVGSDGAQAAFFLVQHAASDLAFQKRCLELLTAAVKQNEASATHMAYLTDRVLVQGGKPQRYGTQFHEINGQLEPLSIEDEVNVDARRKEVGLPPLAEYVKQMREMQRP